MTNQQKIHNKLMLSLCALSVSLAINSLAVAQESSSEDQAKGELERIEVTARKTVESLQEVPVAITSIGAQELQEKGISVITEIQAVSPNTTLQVSRGTNSTLTAFIRGVGQQDPVWGFESGVGIYLNDVFIARPQGAVFDLLDVERIEVLRGPQGTLYGKNTIGGAVKYITKQMSGDFEANIEGTVGSDSQRDIKLTGQLPLIEDKLFLGVGYANLNRDGFGEYLEAPEGQDRENGNKDVEAARLTLEYQATDTLFLRLDWDETEDTSNARGGVQFPVGGEPAIPSLYDSYTSLPTDNFVELKGISFTADWDVTSELSLKYVYSDRESFSTTNIDFDVTPPSLTQDVLSVEQVFDVPAVYEDENSSHELQASYEGEGYSVVSGLYYYDGEACGVFDTILGGIFGGFTNELSGCQDSESYAVYAQTSFDITDKWSATLGARYTDEKRSGTVFNSNFFFAAVGGPVYPRTGWIDGYVRPDNLPVVQVLGTDTDMDGLLDAPRSQSWTRFTPRLGIEYQYDENTLFYASYSQGFKSGAFNPRASTNEDAVEPEIVDSYELGMKKDWNDVLRTNFTLFSLRHDDRQYRVQAPEFGPTAQILANAAKSDVDGFEAEVKWLPSENLTIDFALGWLDAEIEQDPSIALPLFGLSNTPDLTAAVSGSYFIDSEYGFFVINAGYYYRDDYFVFEENNRLVQDGYGAVNISINWESIDGTWYAGLHGKNLTDEDYLTGGYDFVTVPTLNAITGLPRTTTTAFYGDPRTVSLTVGYRF